MLVNLGQLKDLEGVGRVGRRCEGDILGGQKVGLRSREMPDPNLIPPG